MSKIFEDFYFQKLGFKDEAPKIKAITEATNAYLEEYLNLQKLLNEEEKGILDKIDELVGRRAIVNEYYSYKEGFRVGLLLALDAMGFEESEN